MKKLMMALVAALAVTSVMAQTDATTSAMDQKKMDPTEMVTKRTNEMVEKYSLTTEQAAKLKTLNEKYMGKVGGKSKGQRLEKSSTSETGTSTDKSTTKQKPHGGNHGGPDMTAYNTELKAILTDEQYKAYETDMASRKSSKSGKTSKQSK